ncbi:UV excision repair protein Rad23 [Metschnikowia bicuspidata var. bicuspidata NRRL YB-4993]|uniref:UV excision repair protein RAD23 n=1 Tax=Metschnikowia bicuspidata var. bicuspidata NRRL YB-4993 TaxID=869754 RepID=A0A1A0HCG4_9ASCO|nr:UV excision repair protein Rad23 [Metschnikowia bicuspidata var. bicuspidata NRRL YB-4993]OBA21804.1 UV excision repair protein Rad23 [Metschnikowia bicuspidata var. bicuspidata NRRL YB-4993]
MKIKFRDLKKLTVEVDAQPSDSVLSVKEKVAAAKDVDALQLKFVYSGKVLQDDKLVLDFKIKDGDSVITMVSKAKVATNTAPTNTAPTNTAPTNTGATNSTATNSTATNTAATTTAPGGSQSPSSAADFAAGLEREAAVQNMMEMGYDRPEIERALRAAFNNPHRAVEYLLSGIPASLQAPEPAEAGDAEADRAGPSVDEPADAESGHQNLFDAAAAASTDDVAPDDGLGGMSEEGQLALLREAIQSNPELLQPLLERMAATDPQAAAMIAEDPEGFVHRFLSGELGMDVDDADGGDDPEGVVRVELSELDQQAIARLCELGFDRNLVIQVYMACDKNEEVTADILFRDTSD